MSNVAYKTGVTDTSATLSDLGDGLVTGELRFESGGIYKLVQADEIIQDGCALAFGTHASGRLNVLKQDTADAQVAGFNNTGGDVADAEYFWMKVLGTGYVRSSAAWSAGDELEVTTDGELNALVAGAVVAIARAAATGANETVNAILLGSLDGAV